MKNETLRPIAHYLVEEQGISPDNNNGELDKLCEQIYSEMKKLSVSKVDFRLVDPVKAGEEWALDLDDPPYVAYIYIDGREMADIVRPIEEPYRKKEGLHFISEYGHLPVSWLYSDLSEAAREGSFSYDLGVYLFCCGSCGEPGCWSVTCRVTEDDDYVYWFGFEHERCCWEYNLQYKFDKKQYNEAMKKLEVWTNNRKKK